MTTSIDSGRLALKLTNRLRGFGETMLSVRVASSYSTRVFSAALTSAALFGSLGRTSTIVSARSEAAKRTSATYRSRVTAIGDGVLKFERDISGSFADDGLIGGRRSSAVLS